ncbi:hypothetical protein AN1514.2 [Aspergillus nidulans FGSC A4]|uniref:Myb-like DNA-binding domain protein (AFU_orthologue AFUA_8G05190) n=1 Tax=Emericella nidulans (strain FGSC A4 / ATCC 38163 / CBS 112.46 / NRRL 194 / M139) TaxID=227321 RepID=Q5BD66_EMENI|nr:hypothetical protein [Aspergillus nidulans FGSC A4]EAA63827.1 hypothetical protein AN1514.2 [Aspergillus nidulans FGSC A4]CBF85020.1 TPA: Myb-like DNA-binding domain protein (AFU_orthologue; AFUA_8G05190) [Aspergillus nidulans FGSC A4]|eukprot:XP_659118.1 hypothetical protein AN1514.2 [Aspergillus nidulans FGSC A4]
MGSPLKRKRLYLWSGADDEYETSDIDLQEARTQNDLRLKSIFEGIFEKYGRDFTDVGDEIDLQTGKITVNNGHIDALEVEGNGYGDWLSDARPQAPRHVLAERTDYEGKPARLALDADAWGAEDTALEGDHDLQHPGRRTVHLLSHMRPGSRRGLGETTETDSDQGAAGDGEDRATSEAEDDRSSVDSLLGTALSIPAQKVGKTTKGETGTEKAIPPHDGSHQYQAAHTERLDETVDPIWRVPEISAKFTTPTLPSRPRPNPKPVINNAVRSQSPPGASSVWALSGTRKRDTDVVKKIKQKGSPKRRVKHHSSPDAVWDWSFADAPDGSESDDPLQEDYVPSPTPKDSVYIREKRKGPFSAGAAQKTCSFCKRIFSRKAYDMHLKDVLANPADNEHDSVELKRQLATVTGDGTTESAPGATNRSPAPAGLIVRITNTPREPDSEAGQRTNHESTPTGSKRARTVLGPQEARLIIQMRHIQGMKWKEISDHFPQKKPANIQAWHHVHWKQRKANPPRLSGPWSKAELEKLEILKDQPELTWPGIRAEFPGRLLAEIEFKLLQLWAGDNVSQPLRSASPAD